MESAVNQEMDPAVKQSLIQHSKGWRGINNPWMADGDDDEEFQYINLVVNPERYTGYKVRAVHRVQDEVAREHNCQAVVARSLGLWFWLDAQVWCGCANACVSNQVLLQP